MIYARFNSKAWNTLLYSMVVTGLKEKDYWFFTSDFYKNFLEDYLNEETKLKVKDFVIQWKREHEETTKSAIECAKSLIDNDFVKMFNLFGGKQSLIVSK